METISRRQNQVKLNKTTLIPSLALFTGTSLNTSPQKGRASPLSALDWLRDWYRSQCNRKWERVHGVTIETLDCPGWLVTIDLEGTKLESTPMAEIRVERLKTDWIDVTVEHGRFYGQADRHKLECSLLAFHSCVPTQHTHLAPPTATST